MSRLRRLIALGAALMLGYGAGFGAFLAQVPSSSSGDQTQTEAIVVLTGGRQRLSTGLKLQAQGLARKVFISGVNPEVEPEELAGFGPLGKAQIDCCVILGYAAANTLGNAAETAGWVRAVQIRSIRLVTAAYHMPRSLFELHRAAPELIIIPHPVFPPGFPEGAWMRADGLALLLSEYHKLLRAWARALLHSRAA
jgi:uncharacterized SAM-binding protein YcdF (DUF218 family)